MNEDIFGVFETIFSKVQKRAMTTDEHQLLRLEINKLVKVMMKMLVIAADAQCAKHFKILQDMVAEGFDEVERDIEQLKKVPD